MNPEPVANPETATGRFQYKWILLLVVSGGGFLSIMNGGMVNIGAPSMIEAFQSNASLIAWVHLGFTMAMIVPLLPLPLKSETVEPVPSLSRQYPFRLEDDV